MNQKAITVKRRERADILLRAKMNGPRSSATRRRINARIAQTANFNR